MLSTWSARTLMVRDVKCHGDPITPPPSRAGKKRVQSNYQVAGFSEGGLVRSMDVRVLSSLPN